MGDTWKVIEEQIYAEFKIFNAKRSKRLNPRTSKPFDFFLMSGMDWVNVIPVTPEGDIVLVRQLRHGINDYTLEIPGGVVEAGEDPKLSALRELKEETGYVATDAEKLGTIHANPAMQSMRLHTFVARNATLQGPQILDPGEDIAVVTKTQREVRELILGGQITHALVVAAFGLLSLKDRGTGKPRA